MTYSSAHQALLDSVPQTHPTRTEHIAFDVDGQGFAGFIARPDDDAAHPAVLVFSDWSGLGEHAKVRAEMLARFGYIALAGDIYGDGERPDDPGATAGRFYGDSVLFRERAAANLTHLKTIDGVDTARVAALGYCFGGSASLELARSGADVAGVISFHGGLQTNIPAAPGAVKARVLVLAGAADPVAPDAAVQAFEDEMRAADTADWQLHSYSGAMHAFTMPEANSPEHGAAFDARANQRSWIALLAFLDEILAA